MSDKKKITMLDLVGSPSFNYTAAADALNTTNRKQLKKQKNTEGIHNFLMGLGFAVIVVVSILTSFKNQRPKSVKRRAKAMKKHRVTQRPIYYSQRRGAPIAR